ncbi:N-acetylmuramoyl-L-alanine amidase [Raineyella fluvialis]|uniref:N-acetylmuramoyl-L-alanine amidase n=1 Tax=Raineyella fluvialis TaxID=2662261 RepID=A0A5Q2FHJ2_9ACTN|nr:N-acetylmuramoyl-L-alanine amidase [Raineyella fluvialis]QGF24603.1 hypothetical protein Rai3103_14275 [Raineyella fluvialis]
MSRITRAARRIVAAVVVAVVAAAAAGVAPARANPAPRSQQDTRSVGQGPVALGFPIQYFGVIADLVPGAVPRDDGPAPYGEARFRVGGKWTDWQPLEQDGAQAAGHFTGALVDVAEADAYQVRNLPSWGTGWRAAAINTARGVPEGLLPRASAASTASCRSRADWGADESISGWSHGDVQAFSPAQVLTVHHTAGSNDPNQDYAATVRAIYVYHVQSNKWSDIGYQYLIDGKGVVYEGRNSGHTSLSCLTQGGDGHDFAHQTSTDQIVTGAHVANYNSGNVGIALMGCFENSSACSGDTNPPAPAVDSLESQIAALSVRHGLTPTGTTHYVNPVSSATKDIATVSGHRDWDATACPGGNLYGQLPTIRSTAAARMGAPGATTPDAPGGFSAIGAAATVTLNWSPPADGGSPITGYQAFRGAGPDVSAASTLVYSGAATSASDRPPGGTYYYAVRACNAVGCGPLTVAGPVSVTVATITSATCTATKCSFAGTGAGTLQWSFGSTASPATATGSPVTTSYSTSGTYTVRLTDGNQTSATRTVVCSKVRKGISCKV